MVKHRIESFSRPKFRCQSPYTRFACDYWACYRKHGLDLTARSVPRLDKETKRLLFEFCDLPSDSVGNVCNVSAKSSTDVIANSEGSATSEESFTSRHQVSSKFRAGDKKISVSRQLLNQEDHPLSPSEDYPVSPSNDRPDKHPEILREEDEDATIICEEERSPISVPPYIKSIEVTTTVDKRSLQKTLIGSMSKIISKRWNNLHPSVVKEYRRLVEEEKEEYGSTMVHVLRSNDLPVPMLIDNDISSNESLNVLYNSVYSWFKMRPNLFSSPFFASTVRTKLEKRCTRGLRREMDKLRPALQSSRIQITLPESSLPEQPGKGCDVNSGDGSLICDLTSAPSSPEYQVKDMPSPRYCSTPLNTTPLVTPANHLTQLKDMPSPRYCSTPLNTTPSVTPANHMTQLKDMPSPRCYSTPSVTPVKPNELPRLFNSVVPSCLPYYNESYSDISSAGSLPNVTLPAGTPPAGTPPNNLGLSGQLSPPVTPSFYSRIPTLQPLTPTTHDSILINQGSSTLELTPQNGTQKVNNSMLGNNYTPGAQYSSSTWPFLQPPYQGMFYSPYLVRPSLPSNLLYPSYQWGNDVFPSLNYSLNHQNRSSTFQNPSSFQNTSYFQNTSSRSNFTSLNLQDYSLISSLSSTPRLNDSQSPEGGRVPEGGKAPEARRAHYFSNTSLV